MATYPNNPPAVPRSFVADARAYFPRAHPSTDTAVYLGLLSLIGLGPIAGIPAVLLARIVLREISAGSNVYTGRGAARVAAALGWTGTSVYSALVVGILASTDQGLGRGLVIVGLALALLAVVGVFNRQAQRYRFAVASVAAGAAVLVVGGSSGIAYGIEAKERARREAAQACSAELVASERELMTNAFDSARRHLARAKETCGDSKRTAVQTQLAIVDQKETAFRRAEALREKQEAEAREVEASDRFAKETPRIKQLLGTARASANAGGWDRAWQFLAEARTTLASFTNNRVATTEAWQGLVKQAEAERPRIEKAREAIREHRERQEEAKRQQEEAKRQQEEARAAAAAQSRQARPRFTTVLCCDGTRSPSCGCDRSSFRGCCSHHGGICGYCDD